MGSNPSPLYIRGMFKFAGSLLALALVGLPLYAQGADSTAAAGRCAVPDTITVVGNSRVDNATIRATIGLVPRTTLNYRDVQRAVKALYATGNYDDIRVICTIDPTTNKASLNVHVKERPVLASTSIRGVSQVSKKDVDSRLQLPVGTAVDPAKVALAVARADSLYESKGFYLARVHVDSTLSGDQLKLAFTVDEGRRLAIAGIGVSGNRAIPARTIVGAMETQPEGFWFFRDGEFDDATYAGDLTDRIPSLYASRGYIDFRLLQDTMRVDHANGKGEIQLKVEDGPRYTVGDFEIFGNKAFSTQALRSYFPFDRDDRSLAESALGILRHSYKNPQGTFDQSKWDDATQKVKEAYSNEGYIYAVVQPVEERVPSTDSVRKVNLRWQIDEKSPAIVNRIDIAGNDYTYESCIREQIVMAPGQVFKRDYLMRSYQNIANLNFFDSPMPEPDVKPDANGDVDITFKVKEKRTGNVNFGASMGQGTGLGGFIGLDQPNLFGRCKRAQLNWQFGKYINDFSLTYSDPNIRDSRISGSVTAYNTKTRYTIADLGQSTRIGGQLQFGFPVPNSYFSRIFLSYGGESVKYGNNTGTLLSTIITNCKSCFRSSVGASFQHDTRLGLPFATQGGLQNFSATFNGGPLGGTANFQKYTTELRSYAPLAYIGGNVLGGQPMTFVAGLTARAGAVLGDPGPFFSSQSFALGGTQYGEPLRGYCEFSITPAGYDPSACNGNAKTSSFGNAFFVATAELGLRVNQSVYLDTFMEGGNVWARPRDFDPTRLFRSVGVGGSVVSPLGPLGVDFAYGLDRVDAQGHSNPGWKVHFKLGQYF
jgi:outer membrane protein insertion porin family